MRVSGKWDTSDRMELEWVGGARNPRNNSLQLILSHPHSEKDKCLSSNSKNANNSKKNPIFFIKEYFSEANQSWIFFLKLFKAVFKGGYQWKKWPRLGGEGTGARYLVLNIALLFPSTFVTISQLHTQSPLQLDNIIPSRLMLSVSLLLLLSCACVHSSSCSLCPVLDFASVCALCSYFLSSHESFHDFCQKPNQIWNVPFWDFFFLNHFGEKMCSVETLQKISGTVIPFENVTKWKWT